MHIGPARPFFIVLVALSGFWIDASASTPALCQSAAREALGTCTSEVAQAQSACHQQTGAACNDDNPAINDALAALSTSVLSACTADAIADAELGPAKTPASFAEQLGESCTGEVATISARTYGGPNATLLDGSNAAAEACLIGAAGAASSLLKTQLDVYAACIESTLAGDSCDLAAAMTQLADTRAQAEADVAAACPAGALAASIGFDVARYVGAAAAQAQCMTSASFGDTAPFALDCGPTDPPPPGVPTPVLIDDLDVARCADGSPYQFWIKMPAPGLSSNKLLVFLQGGGVCTLQQQCEAVAANNPGLFTATDDGYPVRGILGESTEHPFQDYTRVYLPYCTQDVHLGAGTTQVFSDTLTVQRWGSRNVRAALSIVRNMLWGKQRQTLGSGYRPDQQTVLFSGNSAGGFGVLYNYHYLLDDLRWHNTDALPGAAMALDNGQGTGIVTFAAVAQTLWDARAAQPSYCQDATCAAGPIIANATGARLTDQRVLWISNQVDATQGTTTGFASPSAWTSAVRDSYCANQGTAGVQYFLSARSASTHGMLSADGAYLSVTGAGVPLTDWLSQYGGRFDAVSEGTLANTVPGVAPFDCPVDNPDFDLDGVGALNDNCLALANAEQIDADGDGIGNACDTDLNNDCITNAIDLGLLRLRYFTSDPVADFNSDGVVNVVDLGILRQQFFSVPGPSGLPTACDAR